MTYSSNYGKLTHCKRIFNRATWLCMNQASRDLNKTSPKPKLLFFLVFGLLSILCEETPPLRCLCSAMILHGFSLVILPHCTNVKAVFMVFLLICVTRSLFCGHCLHCLTQTLGGVSPYHSPSV